MKDVNVISLFQKRDPTVPTVAQPTVVDLFAGAGGISEGFRQAGYSIRGGLEIDPDAAATFALNFPEAKILLGDIRDSNVRASILDLARGVDVIVGGPPCQAFSQVRNHSRLMNDPRNVLYREFVRIVGMILPRVFLMENVTGMDQMGVRDQISSDLSLGGEYRVLSQVVDAVDFGVPQTRKRLLFIGIHRSVKIDPPALRGTNASSSVFLQRCTGTTVSYRVLAREDALAIRPLGTMLADPEDVSVVTVAQAISDLEPLETGNRRDRLAYSYFGEAATAYQRMMRLDAGRDLLNVQVPRIRQDTRIRLDHLPPGGNHRDLAEEMLARYLTGQRWGQDNGTGKLSRRHFYAYRRLHPNIWAWTLNTKADAAYHYSVSRSLSVREFARLQSFPDRFVFTADCRRGALPNRVSGGPAHSRYRQVGNAVPPLLAKAAAEALYPAAMTSSNHDRQSA